MDIKKLIQSLHPLERKIVPVLREYKDLHDIASAAGLKDVEAMRALQWLENKKVLKLTAHEERVIGLGINGVKYKEDGFPERIALELLSRGPKTNEDLVKAGIDSKEVNSLIGLMKQKKWAELEKTKKGLTLTLTATGKKAAKTKLPQELFLEQDFPLKDITNNDEKTIKELQRRKDVIVVRTRKTKSITLTSLGKKLVAQDLGALNVIDALTPKMLKTGTWKGKKFRRYDVEINVPAIHGGRRHFVSEAVEYIKRIWLDMGFQEMTGTHVQSAFWDLDALFVPQDHPAREMQDTFYLEGRAKLPAVAKKVKATHERGGDTGSTGWGGLYSEDEAKRLLLRTHTTVLSAQTLASLKKDDLPAKFFCVGKVFRNEALSWKHLFEFYQVEGIVVDPDANLKHLKGYLRQFYRKMGFEKVRMRPAHFPYTEPSLEVDVFHPVKKEWVELGGAGIFRPEVVQPLLGFDCPVLAWGQGMGRIISEYWNITDIRDLYKNDLKHMRTMKVWMK